MVGRTIVMGVSLGVAAVAPAAAAVQEAQFNQVRYAATVALHEGKWERAYADLKKLHAWVPDAETVSLDAARVAAKLGLPDESFDWLDKAIASGYAHPDRAQAVREFEVLHEDPRWLSAIAHMGMNREAEGKVMLERRPDRDPSTTPAFKSYKKLDLHYQEAHASLHHDGWKMSRRSMADAALLLVDERIAATRRYLAEHPGAKDRDEAAWGAVRGRVTLRRSYRLQERWGDAGLQTIEEIDAFLAANPSSPYRADAMIQRAFTRFHVRPEGGTPGRPWTDEDLAELVASLGEVARTNRGSTGAGKALVWQLVISNVAETEEITPEMTEMHRELSTIYGRNRDVQELLGNAGRGVMMRFRDFDAFEGTDLAGRRWSSGAFKGKVTVVDFWATWCRPCLEELPALKLIWSELRPLGLQVLGVSLDSISRKDFETWTAENDVAWPQIYDGRGFATSMARKFDVRSIPFAVVVGPDGRVAAANLRGEELLETIREMLEHRRPDR